MLPREGDPARGSPGGEPEQRDPPTKSPAVVGTVASEARGLWDAQVAVTMVATRAPLEETDPLLAQSEGARLARSGSALTSCSVSWMTMMQTKVIHCQLRLLPCVQSRGFLRLRSPASLTMKMAKPVHCHCCHPPSGRHGRACVGGGGGAASALGTPSVGETVEV